MTKGGLQDMPYPNIETPIHFHASFPKFGGRNANSVVLHRFPPGSWSSSRSSAPWWRWPPTSGVSAEKLNYFASFKKVPKIKHRQNIWKSFLPNSLGQKIRKKLFSQPFFSEYMQFLKTFHAPRLFYIPFYTHLSRDSIISLLLRILFDRGRESMRALARWL